MVAAGPALAGLDGGLRLRATAVFMLDRTPYDLLPGRKTKGERRKSVLERAGNPAVVGPKSCRPEALCHRLSPGLPCSAGRTMSEVWAAEQAKRRHIATMSPLCQPPLAVAGFSAGFSLRSRNR